MKYLALDNKYTRWYCSIIEKALLRSNNKKQAKELLGYAEGHHIVPRCFKTDNNSIAFLTAKEHFVVHHLLCKMFGDKKKQRQMAYSFLKMSTYHYNKSRKQISAKFYDSAKREFNKIGAWNKGLTKETDERVTKYALNLSKVNVGKKQSKETIEKRISKIIGRKNTIETLRLMSFVKLGDKNPMFGKHLTKEQRIKTGNRFRGKKLSVEHIQNIKNANKDHKSNYQWNLEKYGKEIADQKLEFFKQKCRRNKNASFRENNAI